MKKSLKLKNCDPDSSQKALDIDDTQGILGILYFTSNTADGNVYIQHVTLLLILNLNSKNSRLRHKSTIRCNRRFRNLSLKEVFGADNSDFIDVDLALLGQQPEPGILVQFSGVELSENEQELPE